MRRPLCCVCVAFVVTVFLYLKINPQQEAVYGSPEGSRVKLSGEVSRKEYKEGTLVLTLKNVSGAGSGIHGVICYMDLSGETAEPKLGSTVSVQGTISYFSRPRNPGEFDAEAYYRILGVDCRLYRAGILAQGAGYSACRETLYQIRCYFERIFDRALTPKDASVMKAMVLGNKSELDAQSRQLFQRSGIAHIFAISGLHITLLGMGLYRLLRRMGLLQLFCAALSIAMMTAYGDMTGMSSSACRAVFMFGMQLAARSLGRTYDMLTSLALSAVLILAEQPLYLQHSGFLLSFGAILGIGCMSEVVTPEGLRIRLKPVRRMASSLCAGEGIFLIHFPIMLCVYYEFPVYSFVLNLIVIPAMAFVMASGLLCLGLGSLPAVVGLSAARLAGGVCHLLLAVFEGLCRISQRLPFANWIVGRPEGWRIYAFAAVVLFLYISHQYGRHLSKQAECEDRGIRIGLPFPVRQITALAAVVLISGAVADGASVTFLDVGQGDCICLESSGGKHFLIDGGSTSKNGIGEYTIVPYFKYQGVSRLEAVFLTHLDNDHISGVMEMLDGSAGIGSGIGIGRVFISDAAAEDEAYEELARLCRLGKIPLYRLKAGDRIAADGLELEVLHPSGEYMAASRNAGSLVMKLTVSDGQNREFTALFTGDAEADGEQAAARALSGTAGYEGIDLYKAAHHGSKYSNTADLVSLAHPALTVISCGEDNRYGHPHDAALRNFADAGSRVLVTKDTGAIMIKIKDGEVYETHHTGY